MVLRDRLQEFKDSLPKSPNGNSGRWKPIWPTAADYDRAASEQKAEWPVDPPQLKPYGMTAGVYRFYDQYNQLLYVGKAMNPRRRYEDHRYSAKSPWRLDVHHDAPIDWYETEAEALAAEMRAMETEHPKHNNGGIWFPHRFAKGTGLCPCGVQVVWAPVRQHDWTGPYGGCTACHLVPGSKYAAQECPGK